MTVILPAVKTFFFFCVFVLWGLGVVAGRNICKNILTKYSFAGILKNIKKGFAPVMSIMKKKNKETSEEIVEEVGSAATKIISKGIGALAGAAIGLSAGPAGAVVGAAAGEMLGEAVEIFIKKIPQIADAVKKVKREKAERKRSDMKLAGNIRASEIAKKSASKRSLESRLSVLEEKGNLENAVKEGIVSFTVPSKAKNKNSGSLNPAAYVALAGQKRTA